MDTHTEPTDMDMDTHTDMVTTERDLLMLSQRLMPMLTTHMPMVMDTHTEPTDMDMDTHTDMVTTERDLLMLSQRLMLMPLSCMEPTDMVPTHMLEPTVPTHMPMELTHMPTELTTERDLL